MNTVIPNQYVKSETIMLICLFFLSLQKNYAQDVVCGINHKHEHKIENEKLATSCPLLDQYFNPVSSCDQTFLYNSDMPKHKLRIRIHVLANPSNETPEYGYQHFTEGQDDQIIYDLVDQMNTRLNKTNMQNIFRGGFTYPDVLNQSDPNNPIMHNKGFEYVLESVPGVDEEDQENNGIVYYYPSNESELESFYFCDKLKWNNNPGGPAETMVAYPCGTNTSNNGIASYSIPPVVWDNFVPEAVDIFLVPYHPNYIRYFIDNQIVDQSGNTPIPHTRFTGYASYSNPYNVNAGFYHYRNNPNLYQSGNGSIWGVETGFSNLVNHETGHNLSLSHPNGGTADIPPHSVSFRCNGSSEHHNTMMDYSCDQTALSPMQRYKIGRKLYNEIPDYLIRDQCDIDFNLDLEYTIDQTNYRYVFNSVPVINDSPASRKIWTVCSDNTYIRTAGDNLSLNMVQFHGQDIEVSLELYNEVEDCYYSRTEEDFTLNTLPIDPSLVSNVTNSIFIENELYEGYNLITNDNWNQVGENYIWEIDSPLPGVYIEDPCANNPTVVLDDSYPSSTEIYLCGTAFTSTTIGPKVCHKICIPEAYEFDYEVSSCENGAQLIINTAFPNDIIVEGRTIQYWIDNYPNFIDNGNGEYEFNLGTNSGEIQIYACEVLLETIDLTAECACALNYIAEVISCQSNQTYLQISTNYPNDIYLENNTIQYWVTNYPQFEDLGNGEYLFNIIGAGSIELDISICDEVVEVISIPEDCPCKYTYEYFFTSCNDSGQSTMVVMTDYPDDIILEGNSLTYWIANYSQFIQDQNGNYIFQGLPNGEYSFMACGSLQEVVILPEDCEEYMSAGQSEGRSYSLKNESKYSQISVYPNPVSSTMFVSLPDDSTLSIIGYDGRVIKTLSQLKKGLHELNISELKEGMYFLRDHSTGEVQRFIKL